MLSLPGLTGQSSIPGRWLLDRPVKPGDDSIVLVEKCSSPNESICVGLVAAAFLEIGHVDDSLVGGSGAVLDDDVDQGAFDILPHAHSAANIEMRAFRQPGPDVVPDLTHAVLHIEFILVVARPGKRQACKNSGRLHAVEFILVEEIAVMTLVAEEQPVAAGRLGGHALVQKGAERGDAGAGTDHDDGHGGISRQAEIMRLLDIDLDVVAGGNTFG